MQNRLTGPTGWKERWPEWKDVYSKCLQMAIRRIKQSESVLESLQARGYDVGRLKWKAPREFRSIVVEYDPEYPEKPVVEEITPEETVGIDLGITKFIHDSDGRSFESLDEQRDRDRIDHRHRNLSRKEHGSNNWEQARQKLAQAYERVHNRRKDSRDPSCTALLANIW